MTNDPGGSDPTLPPDPDPTVPVPPTGAGEPVTPPAGTPQVPSDEGGTVPPAGPAGPTGPGGPGGPGGPDDAGTPPEGEGNRTWSWVAGIAVLVALVVAIVVLLVTRDDDDGSAGVDTTTTTVEETTTTTAESTTTTEATTTTTQPPREISGTGSRVVELSPPLEQGDVLTVTHDGSGDFSVRIGDADDPIVDTSGDYDGTVLYDGEDQVTSLEVTADGSWTITIQPSAQLGAWDPASGGADGEGDDVLRLAEGTGAFTADITNTGDGAFTVSALNEDWDADELVDTDGDHDAAADVPGGTVLLVVRSSGSWTISES